jgi:hypothetical protein
VPALHRRLGHDLPPARARRVQLRHPGQRPPPAQHGDSGSQRHKQSCTHTTAPRRSCCGPGRHDSTAGAHQAGHCHRGLAGNSCGVNSAVTTAN